MKKTKTFAGNNAPEFRAINSRRVFLKSATGAAFCASMPPIAYAKEESAVAAVYTGESPGVMDFTPLQWGYSMPGEWTLHKRCWMAWPTNRKLWHNVSHLQAARNAYAHVANSIAKYEPLIMIVRPDDAAEARKLLNNSISVYSYPLQDGWMRDIGPQFVVNRQNHNIAGVDWGFNGWGGHFTPYDQNAAIARIVLSLAPEKPFRFVGRMILEGGSVHVDGDGTALSTTECLLNGDRNPHLTKKEIEKNLHDYLGIEKMVWLPYGLTEDATDGHVDNVACFAAPGKVVAATASETDTGNYSRLQANLAALRAATDARGRRFDIVEIALPKKILRTDYEPSVRLPMSYVNFYFANGAVILPVFDDANDAAAVKTITGLFPGRVVETVPGTAITYGGGGVHCITQQQPEA